MLGGSMTERLGHVSRSTFSTRTALVVAAVGALGLAAGLLLPFLVAIPSLASRRPCAANLKQIGLGVELYRQDNGGRMPTPGRRQLFDLIFEEGHLDDAGAFLCPDDDDRKGAIVDANVLMLISYESWQGGLIDSQRIAEHGSRLPLAWDREASHHQGARSVLFCDGHVEQLEEAVFESTLEEAATRFELRR